MPWSIINLAVSFLVFGLLAKITPCNRAQGAFAVRELGDDALYWFVNILFYGALPALILQGALGLLFQAHAPSVIATVMRGYGWAAKAPLVQQAALVIVILDFVQYWLHRAFHGAALWPFHAVHHSARAVDWTTTWRVHPVNFAVYSAGAVALVRLLGFSPAAFVFIGPFNLVMGAMVHANLDWTFGPFRYVLASPVFHRWHHVRDPVVRDKNFSPSFPIFDVLFGTFYMPQGVLPQDYGVDGAPEHFLAQLVWPFAVIAGRLRAKAPAPEPAA